MILYDKGRWNLGFAFSCKGSVFPRALVWAVPSGILGCLMSVAYSEMKTELHWDRFENVASFYGNFAFIVSFLVVFRTQQAYSRYWEGASLLRQTRGEWFEAASSLVAFSNRDPFTRGKVKNFHNLLIRLMSHLHYSALMSISECDGKDEFEIADMQGVDPASIEFLHSISEASQQCEVIMHWIQRLILDMMRDNVLSVEAPIVARILHELSQGMVKLVQARNLSDVPFPFPYAQILTILLLAQSIMVPVLTSLLMDSAAWSAALSFALVFANVACNYIACDLESPFGDDTNDLPLASIQRDFNAGLVLLLRAETDCTPTFTAENDSPETRNLIGMNKSISSRAMKKTNFFASSKSHISCDEAALNSPQKERSRDGTNDNSDWPNSSVGTPSRIRDDNSDGLYVSESAPSRTTSKEVPMVDSGSVSCSNHHKASDLQEIPWESEEAHVAPREPTEPGETNTIPSSKYHRAFPFHVQACSPKTLTIPRPPHGPVPYANV